MVNTGIPISTELGGLMREGEGEGGGPYAAVLQRGFWLDALFLLFLWSSSFGVLVPVPVPVPVPVRSGPPRVSLAAHP